MWEGVHQLRKLEFPESTERAVRQLKTTFVRDDSGNIPGLGGASDEMVSQIVDDFVFAQPRGKAGRIPQSIVELHVFDQIIKLYRDLAAEDVTQTISFSLFQALFGKASTDMDRIHLLAKLLSLAISVECRLLLDSAAMWMQLQGVQTSCVQLIIEQLMRDFTSVVSETSAQSKLTELPGLSQHFACIFISGVTTMCKFPGPLWSPQSRPFYNHFLPMLTDWIIADPRLCLVSLLQSQSAQTLQPHGRGGSLWTSPTKPNNHTAVPGLVRWTTQGPISNVEGGPGEGGGGGAGGRLSFGGDQDESTTATKADAENHENCVREADLETLWSRLHLGVLQTLSVFPALPGASQLEVITLGDMKKILDELVILVRRTGGAGAGAGGGASAVSAAVGVGLDRMVQVIQIGLATGAFRCSLADLKSICNQLPDTKLRRILESHHLSNNPPAMHNAS